MSNGKNNKEADEKKKNNDCLTFFVWRVTYFCVHVTQAQFLPTSSKHVSPGMRFLGLGIGGLSHQSCMSLHIGTNNIVGGSITVVDFAHASGVISKSEVLFYSINQKLIIIYKILAISHRKQKVQIDEIESPDM